MVTAGEPSISQDILTACKELLRLIEEGTQALYTFIIRRAGISIVYVSNAIGVVHNKEADEGVSFFIGVECRLIESRGSVDEVNLATVNYTDAFR